MSGACTDVYDAAAEYLDLCRDAVATTPGGIPADCAVYLSPAPPPWDVVPCVVVHVGGPQVSDTLPLQPSLRPGTRAAVQGEVDLVSLTATILRCAPMLGESGEPPTVTEFSARTLETSSDLWAVWAFLKARKKAGLVFAPDWREMFLDPAISLVAGDAVGWSITVRVALDGYDPLI